MSIKEGMGGTAAMKHHDLIASDRVEGTNVYRSDGTKVGSVERLMIDKRSGHVAYAVMQFGGFLGLGHDHYPLPWSVLTYNEELGGYEVNVTDEQLKGAPGGHSGDKDFDYGDRSETQRIYDYYGVPPYWI